MTLKHREAERDRPLRKDRQGQRGMLLIEALVAMVIVATVTISYIGIRTTALIDATRARNWRLAREIAEERLSELQAGAREIKPESGSLVPIDKYEGFSYKFVLGETGVADIESEVARLTAGDDGVANDRIEWQRNRADMRKANSRGLDYAEYDELRYDDIEERLAEKTPSADEFEEVAIIVYFPKLDPDYPGQEVALLIKSRVSTLAISGMTPDQATALDNARSGSSGAAGAAGAGGEAMGAAAGGDR